MNDIQKESKTKTHREFLQSHKIEKSWNWQKENTCCQSKEEGQ